MMNRAMVHLSQGVRHCAEGCVASGWNLASVITDPIGAPASTLLYLFLPLVWGTPGGDLLEPQYSWDHKWQPTVKKYNRYIKLKKRTPFKDPYKNYFRRELGT
jgi:hypothetical protein